MIRANVIDQMVQIDGITFSSGIRVSGSTVQTYYSSTGEFYPDRGITGMETVLEPWVTASDSDGINEGGQAITSVTWYVGAPLDDGSNKITSTTEGYVISGDTLSITKNIPSDSPEEIFAVFYFTDARTSKNIMCTESVKLSTVLFTSSNYKMSIDNGKVVNVSPLKLAKDGTEATQVWPVEITARLELENEEVTGNVVYFLEVSDPDADGGFRALSEEEKAFLVYSYTEGSNKVTIDARFIISARTFRFYGTAYTGTKPTSRVTAQAFADCTVNVLLPQSLSLSQQLIYGARQSYLMNTETHLRAHIYYNNGDIESVCDGLFLYKWYMQNANLTSAKKFTLPEGRDIVFVPIEISKQQDGGLNPLRDITYWCELYMWESAALLSSANDDVYVAGNSSADEATAYVIQDFV